MEQQAPNKRTEETRLSVSDFIVEFPDATVRTIKDYNHTKHRYSCTCSLRSTGSAPSTTFTLHTFHMCAVTLLRVPPGPTVIVGPAHCTYVCKKDANLPAPHCCCDNGPTNCKADTAKCGPNPRVSEMTGEDAEIICGEWETTSDSEFFSEEDYNIVLPIKDIFRHPWFNTSFGAGTGAGNDIAVFKVDDSALQNTNVSINPACLPPENRTASQGVHTGWSAPPSFSFLDRYATGYAPFYRDFHKQWHYKMEITSCNDPSVSPLIEFPLQYPANTFYPPGVMCAKEIDRDLCMTGGDSGSTLMLQDPNQPVRFYAEGILSFTKVEFVTLFSF